MPDNPPVPAEFVWYDLATVDRPGAVAFYGGLFGWTTREVHLGPARAATTFRSGDHDVGGLVIVESGCSRWLPFLGVENVETVIAAAGRLGGSVASPSAPGSRDEPAPIVLDPTGAAFCPVPMGEPADPLGDAAMPGHFCWSELLTCDPGRAAPFYEALFGWTAAEWNLGDQGRYWLFRRGDRDVAGMMAVADSWKRESFWLPYVQVLSAEDTAGHAVELGGRILLPPGDVPGRGRFAVIEDPGGARVAVFALTEAA